MPKIIQTAQNIKRQLKIIFFKSSTKRKDI